MNPQDCAEGIEDYGFYLSYSAPETGRRTGLALKVWAGINKPSNWLSNSRRIPRQVGYALIRLRLGSGVCDRRNLLQQAGDFL